MRCTKWVIGVTVTYVVALVVFASMPPTPGVTRSNYYRLRTGMTKSDVETLFAGPSHDPSTVKQNGVAIFFSP